VTDDRNYLAEQTERLRRRLYVCGLASGPDSADALLAEAGKFAEVGLQSAEEVVDALISAHRVEVSLGYTLTQAEADAYWRRYGQPTDADFDALHAKVRGAVPELSVGYVRKRAPKPPKRGKTRRSRKVRSTRARAKRRVEQRVSRSARGAR